MLMLNMEAIRNMAKQIIKQKGSQALLHIDAVQAFGKLPINVQKLGADLLTVSAHKINGPKGIGALYVKKGVRLNAITHGGEQEGALIPGTYNTPAVAGFNAAVCEIVKKDKSYYEKKITKYENALNHNELFYIALKKIYIIFLHIFS